MSTAIKIENVSKLYRLGTVGTGTISHDLNRWWHLVRGKEDPYAKVGQINDRTQSSTKNQEPGTKNDTSTTTNQELSTKNIATAEYVWALRDINLEVKQGEILGIIGRNGAGKSTLLKLLSRVTAPTTGSIKTKGRIASLLEVGTGFHPELTGRENIFMNGAILGMRRHEITRQLDEIVEFSGCAKYLDTPVKRYSSGMTVRLGFSIAAHLEPEILIVDEVLAVGDDQFQKRCLGKLNDVANSGRTVLFVSHNMAAIRQLTTTCILIDRGALAMVSDTQSVLNRYADLAEKRISEPQMVACLKRSSWAGDQAIRFVYAENLTPILRRDQSMSIRIGIQSSIECECRMGITLCGRNGDPLGAGFCSAIKTTTNLDCQMLDIDIHNLRLAPGNYSFTLGIIRGVSDLIDAVEEVLHFEVPNHETLPDGVHSWNSAWGHFRLDIESQLVS